MKTWPTVLLLCLPALALGETATEPEKINNSEPGAAPEVNEQDSYNWVDSSHAYATDQAQALTEYMNSFFGDPNTLFEQPESLLRLELSHVWDEEEKDRTKVRLKGKLQLPLLDRRLNLLFAGEERTGVGSNSSDSAVGLSLNVSEQATTRVDATLGISSSDITPGVRYRNQSPFGGSYFYRYTQRLEWETDEGFYTTGQVDLDRQLSDDGLLRWSNRVIYGEETDGTEWRTGLSLRHRYAAEGGERPFAVNYYAAVRGNTDPKVTRNYRIGVLLRRQIYRRFLFAEVEPSYNMRKKKRGQTREGAWKIAVRLEIALERDLRRPKQKNPGLDD